MGYATRLKNNLKLGEYYQFVWKDSDNDLSVEYLKGKFVEENDEGFVFNDILRYSVFEDIVYSILSTNSYTLLSGLVEKYGSSFTISKSSAALVEAEKSSIKSIIKV